MEATSQSRFIAAKLHTTGYIFNMFREALEDMPAGPEKKVLESVCRLYGLWQIEELQGHFLKCEFSIAIRTIEADGRRLLQCSAD